MSKRPHITAPQRLSYYMSIFTCSGVRRDRILVTVSRAAENTLSDGTDVAGMHKYLFANFANLGNRTPLSLHQPVGVQSSGGGVSRIKSTSAFATTRCGCALFFLFFFNGSSAKMNFLDKMFNDQSSVNRLIMPIPSEDGVMLLWQHLSLGEKWLPDNKLRCNLICSSRSPTQNKKMFQKKLRSREWTWMFPSG